MEKMRPVANWKLCVNFLRYNTLTLPPERASYRAWLLLTNLLANVLNDLSAKRIDMIIYIRHNRHRFKWILAFVVFILVLSVAFDDVYGVNTDQHTTYYADNDSPKTSPPPEIPEPTTLIMLASGLVALCWMYRKKQ